MSQAQGSTGTVTARAGRYYRNTRYLLALALFAYGLWNINDGFYRWPKVNEEARLRGFDKMPYSLADLMINRALGVLMPPASVLLLFWALRGSRGEFRLNGDTLSVPGHPPIRLAQIDSMDRRKWDRKGIANVTYQLDGGKTGTFKLDDFVYEREGIDEIFRRIELALQPPEPASPEPASPPSAS